MDAAMTNLHAYADRQTLVRELTERVYSLLGQAVEDKGRASMGVSGGSTPGDFFSSLSMMDIPWQHVVILLVDERWVETADKHSNEHLVRTRLLTNRAARARFIGMKNKAASAGEAEQDCEQRLRREGCPPFDVLILGMGNDGHTASLFPGAEQLQAATDLHSGKICMAIEPPAAPYERMTLTLPAILTARNIFLHITGAEKKAVLEKALAGGPPEEMPIRFILCQDQNPVHIFWAP